MTKGKNTPSHEQQVATIYFLRSLTYGAWHSKKRGYCYVPHASEMRNQTGTDDILVARLIIYRSKPVDTQKSHHVKGHAYAEPAKHRSRTPATRRIPLDNSECALNRS